MKTIIEELIDEDFGTDYSSSRWGRSEEHSSLVVDKNKGIYYWNSRGLVGDSLHYLMNVRGMKFEDAKEYLKFKGYSSTYVLTLGKHKEEDVIVYPVLVEAFHELGQYHRTYWYTRKLTDKTIDRFNLGWYNDWYTIPIFMDGVLRQIQKRRDTPKKEVGRWYKGVPPLLFNSDILRVADTVVVAEGPNDVMALHQQGIPSVCTDSGSGYWQPEWLSRFTKCKEIIVCYDNDQAGEHGARVVAQSLGIYRTKIYNFWEYDSGYSPAYFFRDGGTLEEFQKLIKEKSKYVFELQEEPHKRRKITWTKKF